MTCDGRVLTTVCCYGETGEVSSTGKDPWGQFLWRTEDAG